MKKSIFGVTTLLIAFAATAVYAAEMTKLEREKVVRRSCEAAIWAMPAVGIYDIELALQRDAGAEPGTLGYMSAPMDSRHGFLTANDVTRLTSWGLSQPPTAPSSSMCLPGVRRHSISAPS